MHMYMNINSKLRFAVLRYLVQQSAQSTINNHLLYYIKKQLDAALSVLFISQCKITLHVSDAFCVHHQEYKMPVR